MKPAPFEYRIVHSVEGALQLLAEHGEDASLLAGGQSLIPTMNFRLAQPAVIVDLNPVKELSFIRESETGGLFIGAMTRQRRIERSVMVAERAPLLHEAMPFIAHPQIRNRGTIGGSVAHADPSAELPAVLTALRARFRLLGLDGERWVDAGDFFQGMFSTVREPTELLAEIEIPPMASGAGWAFSEIARRRGDYALVGIATAVTLDAERRCKDARIVFLSAGDGIVEAREAQQALIGQPLSAKVIETSAQVAAFEDIDPLPDMHATAEYRRHLAKVLAVRTLSAAARRVP